MTDINGDGHSDVHSSRETGPPFHHSTTAQAANGGSSPSDDWNDPIFVRRRTTQMAAQLVATQNQLDEAETLNRHLVAMVRDYAAELGRPLAPPPEVHRAMTTRASRMHPITMTAGERELVVVAPPEGFGDPEGTWRNIVNHYRRG